MIEKEFLMRVAKEKGLKNKEHIEKDYFQDLFLSHLFMKSNAFVFKGGTALYKLYNFPRFSGDLDFTLVREENVDNIVEKVVRETNAKLKSKKRTKDSLLYKLGFRGILTHYNTLRIDVNFKNVAFEPEVKVYIPPYIDINPFSLKTISLREMIAEKVHSLLSRKNARDLFDMFLLLRIVKPNRVLIKKKLSIFGMKFNIKEFKERVNEIEGVWEKELRAFVLVELPEFGVVKKFVIERMKEV